MPDSRPRRLLFSGLQLGTIPAAGEMEGKRGKEGRGKRNQAKGGPSNTSLLIRFLSRLSSSLHTLLNLFRYKRDRLYSALNSMLH